LKSALDNSEYYNKLSDEQYKRITGKDKENSSELTSAYTGGTETGSGVYRPDVESSQRVHESPGLAGTSEKVTPQDEVDAARSEFMDAFNDIVPCEI